MEVVLVSAKNHLVVSDITAAVARKPEPLVIEEVIVAPPQVHEVRLKIICTSLFHRDVTFCKLKVCNFIRIKVAKI